MADQRILYLFPDRSSELLRAYEEQEFWPDYAAGAARAGLDFVVAPPDHVAISDGVAYYRDDALSPDRDIVVYGVRTGPTHISDLWTGISVATCLEAMGFWLPIPIGAGILLNDKYATLASFADSPVPVIPTVRLTADRDVHRIGQHRLVPDEWFPVFVKPTAWSGGQGCVPCADRASLEAVLGLAAGSGTGIVVQPCLADVVADTRAIVVEGRIVAAVDRRPKPGSHVANVSRGGSFTVRRDLEPAVHELARMVSDRLDLPYVCIDILRTADGGLWLSELEADGAVSRLLFPPDTVHEVVATRFAAYARRHELQAAR
ncbi:hypothetical protein CA850_14400 [Micromonospora echinospora]|uniref:ATP-grasp domain-containing protein n=1 Tax=Micromonospora echinospora TaxID=1877 RepID=A0A1C4ZA63_MICEC|nr:hypothetical protein [Micromonospora echinospora]OZV80537.1 hypothetical protein CA850_14400 [Micromonospora echinospora]SCF29845.1 ATP-grasp domain-containing protein [Micromonospora echinospora]